MHATSLEFRQFLEFVPEWQDIAKSVHEQGTADGAAASDLGKSTACIYAVLEAIGVQAIFVKLQKCG